MNGVTEINGRSEVTKYLSELTESKLSKIKLDFNTYQYQLGSGNFCPNLGFTFRFFQFPATDVIYSPKNHNIPTYFETNPKC